MLESGDPFVFVEIASFSVELVYIQYRLEVDPPLSSFNFF